MAYRRRKGRCTRFKRVRVKGQGVAKRCAHYAGSSRTARKTKRRRSGSKRKPAGMARKGSRCTRFKRVRVRGGGMQRRCAHYGR